MNKTFKITVDTQKSVQNPSFHVNTNDLRTIHLLMTIQSNGKPVNLEDAQVRIAVLKPDKKTVFQDVVVVDAASGLCEVILDSQAYVVPGEHTAELMIYFVGERVSVTGRFNYRAISGILSDETVESQNEYQAINKLVLDAETAAQNAKQSEINAKESELVAKQAETNAVNAAANALDELEERTEQFYEQKATELRAPIDDLSAQLAQIPSEKVDVTAFGVVGDGVTDITNTLQNVLNEHLHLYIPDGDYIIDPSIGLVMQDNQTIEFSENAWLINKTHNLERYAIITMNGKNQTLIKPNINGKREDNLATTGEYGHGISMRGAINPKIIKPRIINCWGDDIYIGTGTPHWCENVYIEYPYLDNNRRQGISVTSVRTLRIINPIIKNTNGADPQSGIDIEPNNPESHLEDIKIINPYLEDNTNQGLIIALHNMEGSQNFVDITVENPHCVGNSLVIGKCAGNISGVINIINPLIEKDRLFVRDYDKTGPTINIHKPVIVDCNYRGLTQEKYASGIVVFFDTDDNRAEVLGNVNVYEPTVIDTGKYDETLCAVYVQNNSGFTKDIENVNIINPLRLDGAKKFYFNANDSIIEDKYGVATYRPASGTRVREVNFNPKITNEQLPSPKTFTLEFSNRTTPELTFELIGSQGMILQPRENEVILPISNVAGNSIRSDLRGSSLTIKKVDENTWLATKIIGTWH